MIQSHQQTADSIVEQFRAGLGESVRQHIDSEHFAFLATSIAAALSAEQTVAVDLVEELLGKLRTRVDAPQLEL